MTHIPSKDVQNLSIDIISNTEANSELEKLLKRQIWLTNELRNELYELTQKNKYDSIINSIIFSINESTNLKEIFQNAVETIHNIVKCVDHVSIYMLENNKILLKANRGHNKNQIKNLKNQNDNGIAWQTIVNNKTISCSNTDEDNIINNYEKKIGIKSWFLIIGVS